MYIHCRIKFVIANSLEQTVDNKEIHNRISRFLRTKHFSKLWNALIVVGHTTLCEIYSHVRMIFPREMNLCICIVIFQKVIWMRRDKVALRTATDVLINFAYIWTTTAMLFKNNKLLWRCRMFLKSVNVGESLLVADTQHFQEKK